MSIEITYTGYLKDITKIQSETMDIPKNTEALIEKINQLYPMMDNSNYILSVNQKIVKKVQKLNSGDKVLLICPFAGG